MKREELLKSREYWVTQMQLGLFSLMDAYCRENNLNRTQLAEKLGVTKGYVSQVMNGDFDHKISKLADLALACGKVPVIRFEDLDTYIAEDAIQHKPHSGIHIRIPFPAAAEDVRPIRKFDTAVYTARAGEPRKKKSHEYIY
ncbi:MAG: helix-turn-helix transcriptional regulator [Bacteroidia bacterium]|nr:helix-turn-helix transcriptional regulator [Bacteroidia bacterium]